MNLTILLLFGILSISYGIYKIPEHDTCVLRVLLCDDFTKPLTPVDNSTLEMFKTIGELNAVCEELSKFRVCLKSAEIFCKEHSKLEVGFQLLKNRHLAFDLCKRASDHQHVYMMVEVCVNKYSHSVIEFCTDKAVEAVGLDFYLGDLEKECRFLGIMQQCHIAVVTDICGGIAGNLLEKLVVFRGERDFMCIEYEREKFRNLEAFDATLDSYVHQYRNIVNRLETDGVSERIDVLKKDFKKQQAGSMQDRVSSTFQSRISPITDEDGPLHNIYARDDEQSFNSEMFHRTKKRAVYSLSDQEIDSTTIPPKPSQCLRLFYEKRGGQVLSNENYACKTKASFLLIGLRLDGRPYYLGCGVADVLWATTIPLKDISCAWMVNPAAPMPLSKCSILIDSSLLAGKDCIRKANYDLPSNSVISVYETVNDREAKRVAELRVRSFLKYSSTVERSLKSFKKYAHDIRYRCSEQYEANQYLESNYVISESRIGFMPLDVHKNGMVNGESKFSDHKYNFYASENAKYPIDTEIHLISSGNGSLQNEFQVEDTYISRNYDGNFNPLIDIVDATNLEPFTLQPSKPLKPSHHSYRPYELYRPRVGEVLEFQDPVILSEDLGIENAEKVIPKPKILSFEDTVEDNDVTRLNSEEMCPALQENISEHVSKLVRYSKENYINIAGPLDILESENYKKFRIYEQEKHVPFSNEMWRGEEPENINTDNQQNQYEEIYVVTPSTEIETYRGSDRTMSEDAEAQNLDDSQNLNTEDYIKDIVKVKQENNANDLTLEKDFITRSEISRSSTADILESIPNYQDNKHPSCKFIAATTNHEVAPEEEFSEKSEKMFSRRSDQKYPTEMEEIFNAIEILAEAKINVMRLRKTWRDKGMEENMITMQEKTEL